MQYSLVIKQIIKWVAVPLGFGGLGYFLLGPLVGNTPHISSSLSISRKEFSSPNSASNNHTPKEEPANPSNQIEFTVEDITPQEENTLHSNQSISPNFPQANPNPRKPRKKGSFPSSSVRVVEEQSEVKVVEVSPQPEQDSEL